MAEATVLGSSMGTELQSLLMAEDIQPGSQASYQVCKTIYAYHPLGGKIADVPIQKAQSQAREITIPRSPESRVKEAFDAEWKALGADEHIANCARLARVYGIASVALLHEGTPTDRPVDFKALWDAKISFNVLDPLNTAGSLVLNQDPNAMDFQKHSSISVNGRPYHGSRAVTLMNEKPLYIEYTSSSFGFVGRSAYQRILFLLKSYLRTMVTDDLVATKAGVIVAKIKQPGSIADRISATVQGQKRAILKEAQTGNVLSIGLDEAIESLDLHNIDTSLVAARKNILDNIASGAPMPATMINSETLAQGFGEGSEDAKKEAEYINGIRVWMNPLYDWFTKIAQYRAWNPEFYKIVQNEFPDYKGKGYTQAFYEWTNSFEAQWPNLLQEPDSEKAKADDVKLKAIIAVAEVLLPAMDPENKATVIRWLADNLNDLKTIFSNPLELDYEAIESYEPPTALQEPGEPKPFAAADAMTAPQRRLRERTDAIQKASPAMLRLLTNA